ncbi:hypothetical protein PMAYCL1PPCAC_07740 [Pristionchus mayeri]|uniref:Uncharacterized protein n=1 Tax=Pristionchus mayeri TaxID=1317129 RepID=A0AAN4ZIH7_9BILA|nr:hypothetical protein PMAYCL1PPCAC_07740 [Pristionchus mayeri]
MESPEVVFEPYFALPSTTTNVFNVKPSPSTSIRRLQAIIRDLRILLSPLFCDGVVHVMEGLAFKRSAPLRHFHFWRNVKDCMRNAKRVGDSKLLALVGNIEQKLLQSTSHAPRIPILMYIQAALVSRLTRLAQIRRSAFSATDEMIGHMEKLHWLAFARFLVGLIADLSARAKEDGERTVKIIDRISEWIEEFGDDEEAKRILHQCESLSDWWRREAVIGEEGIQPDMIILRRLMVVSDNDVVSTRIIQVMRDIEAEEKRKNELFADIGKSIKWNGEESIGEKEEALVKEEVIDEDEIEEDEMKIEEEENEGGFKVDEDIEEVVEDIALEKREDDDDGWGDFKGVEVKSDSWKKKKKRLRAEKRKKDTIEDWSGVSAESEGVKRKKRTAGFEKESTEYNAKDEPAKKRKSTVVDGISICDSHVELTSVKKKKKNRNRISNHSIV